MLVPHPEDVDDGVRPSGSARLQLDAKPIGVDRPNAQAQAMCDPVIGEPFGSQLDYLGFSRG
jgi:hypothetical protein